MNRQLRVIPLQLLALAMITALLLVACSGSKVEEVDLLEPESATGPSLNETRIRPSDSMVMVFVPEGSFLIGSDENQIETAKTLCEEYPDAYGKCSSETFELETPQHFAEVDAFWIDRTEVTNGQYSLCVEDGACNPSRLADDPTYNGEIYPVAGIPWKDAVDYCIWAGGRLPMEVEWEYAAKGAKGTIYPWGDEFECERGSFSDQCSPCEDGYSGPAPVESFPLGASWCGAMDLAGNVWEWVGDVYNEHTIYYQSNSTSNQTEDLRVLRGGSWGYCPAFLRTTYRYSVTPSANYLAVGFRCVVPLEEQGG
ncbi:MAG: formylglycine-generating enzyme family protein [Anaerolineaceae bacterium]|nr:MAG: formylglycine-generating enzyme family protein [Anaerolineaceae bacterium]